MREDMQWVYVTINPVLKSVIRIFNNREDAREFARNNVDMFGAHAVIEEMPVYKNLEEEGPLTTSRDVIDLT